MSENLTVDRQLNYLSLVIYLEFLIDFFLLKWQFTWVKSYRKSPLLKIRCSSNNCLKCSFTYWTDMWFRIGPSGGGRRQQSHDAGGGDAVLPGPGDPHGGASLHVRRRRLEHRLHLRRTPRPPHPLPGSNPHSAGDTPFASTLYYLNATKKTGFSRCLCCCPNDDYSSELNKSIEMKKLGTVEDTEARKLIHLPD